MDLGVAKVFDFLQFLLYTHSKWGVLLNSFHSATHLRELIHEERFECTGDRDVQDVLDLSARCRPRDLATAKTARLTRPVAGYVWLVNHVPKIYRSNLKSGYLSKDQYKL